jgi:hypothetical protein
MQIILINYGLQKKMKIYSFSNFINRKLPEISHVSFATASCLHNTNQFPV